MLQPSDLAGLLGDIKTPGIQNDNPGGSSLGVGVTGFKNTTTFLAENMPVPVPAVNY